MKNISILTISLALLIGISSYASATTDINGLRTTPATQIQTPVAQQAPAFNYANYREVNPLDVVAKPSFYLNKNIKITGKFDKFSTLGLDYAPAMRSSEKYITFLIQRPDVSDHNLPLAEMKCFLVREDAEKYIDLNSGDRVEFYGTVFSNALGDVWIDVKKFNALDQKPTEVKQ